MFELVKQIASGIVFGHECQHRKTCTEYSKADEVCGIMGRQPERPECYENTCKEIERCPDSHCTEDICHSTDPREIPLQELCWEQTSLQHTRSKQRQVAAISTKTTSSDSLHQQ